MGIWWQGQLLEWRMGEAVASDRQEPFHPFFSSFFNSQFRRTNWFFFCASRKWWREERASKIVRRETAWSKNIPILKFFIRIG